MGRKGILDKLNLSKDEILLYMKGRTENDCGKHFGFTARTLRNYLRKWHITKHSLPPKHYGCVAVYLWNHKGTTLPRSMAGISKLTGCSNDAVVSYMHRRRQVAKYKVRQLPDLRSKDTILRTTENNRISSKWIKSYQMWADKWDFQKVHITAILRNGREVKIKTDIRSL